MSDFESWWALRGCRTIGDPVDYARAAWEAALRSIHPAEPRAEGEIVENHIKYGHMYDFKNAHHRTD